MKKQLFLFASAALLLSSVGTFTSCSDDPIVEEEIQGGDDEGDKDDEGGKDDEGTGDEENVLPDLNGTYSAAASADGTLTMTYNGAELTGKKATFLANEDLTSATIELGGETIDFGAMINNLLPWTVDTYSPVPGMRTISLSNVELTLDENGVASFEGSETKPTYTLNYKGTVTENEEGDKSMSIELTHSLVSDKLMGTWNLAEKHEATGSDPSKLRPLWFNIDSNVNMDLGKIGGFIPIKGNFNKILNTICGTMGSIAINVNGVKGVEGIVSALLKGFDLYQDGKMTATYAWNDDWANPQYSSDMPANSIRYYYGEADGQLYVEVNPSFIVELVSGLLNPAAASRAADPEITKEIGRKLIAELNPVLAAGIPVTYTLDGENLMINFEDQLMLRVFQILGELLQDEYASGYITDFLPSLGLGDMTFLVENLLKQLPYAVNYKEGDASAEATTPGTGNLSGECGYIRIGFALVKAASETAPEN